MDQGWANAIKLKVWQPLEFFCEDDGFNKATPCKLSNVDVAIVTIAAQLEACIREEKTDKFSKYMD